VPHSDFFLKVYFRSVDDQRVLRSERIMDAQEFDLLLSIESTFSSS
jgi:hypothetical protein